MRPVELAVLRERRDRLVAEAMHADAAWREALALSDQALAAVDAASRVARGLGAELLAVELALIEAEKMADVPTVGDA